MLATLTTLSVFSMASDTLEITNSESALVYRFLPAMHDQNVTSQLLARVQNKEIAALEKESKRVFNNGFITRADAEGIANLEETYQIMPDPQTESLEFRRGRLLNRKTMMPPFTRIFLEQKLETVFGPGNWDVDINYEELYINVGIKTDILGLYEETLDELRKILPANLVLNTAILRPYTYLYLNKNYTYGALGDLTYAELSQYS
jgi:hypothetical protein